MKGNIHMSTTQSRNTVIAVTPEASYMPHHIIAPHPKCSHCILDGYHFKYSNELSHFVEYCSF